MYEFPQPTITGLQ